MLGAITLLLVYQTIGEIVVQTTALPVPGPVIMHTGIKGQAH